MKKFFGVNIEIIFVKSKLQVVNRFYYLKMKLNLFFVGEFWLYLVIFVMLDLV